MTTLASVFVQSSKKRKKRHFDVTEKDVTDPLKAILRFFFVISWKGNESGAKVSESAFCSVRKESYARNISRCYLSFLTFETLGFFWASCFASNQILRHGQGWIYIVMIYCKIRNFSKKRTMFSETTLAGVILLEVEFFVEEFPGIVSWCVWFRGSCRTSASSFRTWGW